MCYLFVIDNAWIKKADFYPVFSEAFKNKLLFSSQYGGENMNKIVVVAVALLVCALLLGVGGAFLMESENTESLSEAPTITPEGFGKVVSFEGCPDDDPLCQPPGSP
ncbi:hypothetical protein AYK26_03825 [Euryarchaeota archaeon SM23-78]|nr:MAG: hypothetical protein AYK26_03825 [Euryarchaeota archaeon SM23-78]